MIDYDSTKINGDPQQPDEVNNIFAEAKSVISSLGIAFVPGSSQQLAEAIGILSMIGQYYTDTGAADAYVLGVSPGTRKAPPAYFTGMRVVFLASTANTGASTINVSGLGVKNIKQPDGTVLIAGDILPLGELVKLFYNGTEFVLEDNPIDLASVAKVSGVLPIGNGGVGLATYTQGDVLYASATNVLAKLAKGTTGQILKQGASIPAWGSNNAFGARATRNDNTEYQAATDGYFLGIIIAGASASAGRIIAYVDTTATPTTVLGGANVVVSTGTLTESAYGNYGSFCIPVKSGNYYKGVKSSTGNAPTVTYWWIPIS